MLFEEPDSHDNFSHTVILLLGETWTLKASVVFFGWKNLQLLSEPGRQGLLN